MERPYLGLFLLLVLAGCKKSQAAEASPQGKELFDLQDDPGERKNLINDPKYADLIHELRVELDRRIREALGGKKDQMPIDQGIKGELPDKAIR